MLYSFFGRIWEEEKMPTEWAHCETTQEKVPKKTYYGITLLSVLSKIRNWVILNHLQESMDKRLPDQQTGIRKDRSCTEYIANTTYHHWTTYRMECIMEYINFIDFEKAFDSIGRAPLWCWMDYYGITTKITNMLMNSYEETSCKVIHAIQLSWSFHVRTGVKPGCLLSSSWQSTGSWGKQLRGGKWDPVGTVVKAGWPWLCRQHSSPYTHT